MQKKKKEEDNQQLIRWMNEYLSHWSTDCVLSGCSVVQIYTLTERKRLLCQSEVHLSHICTHIAGTAAAFSPKEKIRQYPLLAVIFMSEDNKL